MNTNVTRRGFLGLAAAVAVAGTGGVRLAVAHEDDQSGTPVAGPHATPHGHGMAGSGTGAAFFTVTNNGTEDDRLIVAESNVAAAVEVHEMKMNGETMEMAPLPDGLPIPAGETVTLVPGGYHIMLIGLTRDLKAGESFQLTLAFEQAGEVELEVPIFVSESAAEDAELPSATVGDIVIENVWSRHAPALLGDGATPVASPGH